MKCKIKMFLFDFLFKCNIRFKKKVCVFFQRKNILNYNSYEQDSGSMCPNERNLKKKKKYNIFRRDSIFEKKIKKQLVCSGKENQEQNRFFFHD